MAEKYCMNCGSLLPEDANYCYKCGARQSLKKNQEKNTSDNKQTNKNELFFYDYKKSRDAKA